MPGAGLKIALIHEVFHEPRGAELLRRRLGEARKAGAALALLPELPLNSWAPATRVARAEDAEEPGGPRERLMAAAASEAGIGILGGVIQREPVSGRRFNRALLFDPAGSILASYDKLHVPAEEGYWESDHYEPGAEPPARIDAFGVALGIQICSDLNRPEGCHLLGAQGVGVVLAPRATPSESYDRWRLIIQANALTSAAYVLSANRRGPESGTEIGGPSLAVGPDGEVLVESAAPVSLVSIDQEALERARRDYPGYLPVRSTLYARAWATIAGTEEP